LDKKFFTRNRKALYETIPDGALLVVCSGGQTHLSSDEEFRFTANRNFVYLTGVIDPDCILLARRVRGEMLETLYVREPNLDEERWTGRRIPAAEATEISGIEDIAMRGAFDAAFLKMATDTYFKEIYLCLEANPGQHRTDQNRQFHRDVLEKFPTLAVRNAFHQIASQRMIKSPEEVTEIEAAMAITDEAIRKMLKECKNAKTEMDLFAEFMYVIHKHGAVESAYKPIIACGPNNFYLHYDTPSGKLIDGALCLIDVGAIKNFCRVDISRVFPRSGVFGERQEQIYNIALEVNDIVTAKIKPGMFFKDINEMNRELTFPRLKDAGVLTDVADLGNYVWHRCSHHIGFDIHDVGSYEMPLAVGNYFSMDMGIYIREWGIGLRIEDDVIMTADGLRNLSSFIPRTVQEIETAME